MMEFVALLEALVTDAETFADAIKDFAGVSIVIEHKTADVGDELRGLLRPDVGKEGLALNHGEQAVQHIAAAVIGHCVCFSALRDRILRYRPSAADDSRRYTPRQALLPGGPGG